MTKLRHILYAEDNQNDIDLTLAAFEECGLANPVDIVRDGEEALDYLFFKGKYTDREKAIPAFVLLDLKMPKIDGIETLQAIRNSKEYKNLPVVMLTSSTIESDIARSYELGINAFVVKPIDFSDFVKTVKGIGYFWAILNISPDNL